LKKKAIKAWSKFRHSLRKKAGERMERMRAWVIRSKLMMFDMLKSYKQWLLLNMGLFKIICCLNTWWITYVIEVTELFCFTVNLTMWMREIRYIFYHQCRYILPIFSINYLQRIQWLSPLLTMSHLCILVWYWAFLN
jgi:hypothetical protein